MEASQCSPPPRGSLVILAMARVQPCGLACTCQTMAGYGMCPRVVPAKEIEGLVKLLCLKLLNLVSSPSILGYEDY